MIYSIKSKYPVWKANSVQDVNLIFTPGNCYGIIGATGPVNRLFLKNALWRCRLPQQVRSFGQGERLSVLKQDHFEFDDCIVLDTVMMDIQSYGAP